MLKNIKDKEDKEWSLEIGLYPGILFGMRSYAYEESTVWVLYLPFVDIALEVDN
jgi:hypothetical protein